MYCNIASTFHVPLMLSATVVVAGKAEQALGVVALMRGSEA